MSTITATIQLRRDTAANWTNNNPVLLAGEMALSTDVLYTGTDQPRYKIGNGVDTWLNLDYVPEGGVGFPENLYLTVVNKTGDNLLASGYKVVRVSSAQGQRLAVDYALADSDANSADTIGIVYENIDNNQSGKLVVIGELTGLDTTGSLQGETWTDGDLLFLSPFVDGGITNVRPTAPNHSVIIGYVVYAHANNGKIYCKIDNGYEIGELHNVYAPSPNNNDGIFWSSGTTRYENKSVLNALNLTWVNITSSCTFVGWSSYTTQQVFILDLGAFYMLNLLVTGTSNSTTTTIQLPYTSLSQNGGVGLFTNNGTTIYGRYVLLANDNVITFRIDAAGNTFASTGTKGVGINIFFRK